MATAALAPDPTNSTGRDARGEPEVLLYLAGPLTGRTFDEAANWRQEVRKHLAATAPHIRCLDPMRGKPYLQNAAEIGAHLYHRGPLGPRAIVARDLWDLRRADIVMMNLAGAESPSVGCMVELGIAYSNDCLTVVVLDSDEGNPHDHIFVHALASAVVPSVDKAIAVVEAL